MNEPSDPLVEIGTQTLWDAVPDGLAMVDADGRIVATNLALERLFGYTSEELVGEPIELLVPPDLAERHIEARRVYGAQPTSRPMSSGLDLTGIRKDQVRLPLHISLAPLKVRGGQLILATVRDMSERVRVEDELADANHRRAIAEDHDRIARELHDTVIQELFAVGLGLQGIQTRAESPEVGSRIAKAVDDIDETISAIRFTIYELSQPARPTESPRARLLSLIKTLSERLGFEPKVHLTGPIDTAITPTVAEQLEPAIREAVTNIARHAGATFAAVHLTVDDHITLEVLDNGSGIGQPTRRSGLTNLAERAAYLGGMFEARGRDEGGTVVRWRVPRPIDEADADHS